MPGKGKLDKRGKKFVVERILARRRNGAEREYKIKWLGYPKSENSWQPEDGLTTIAGWLADYNRAQNAKEENKRMSIKIKQMSNGVGINLERRKRSQVDDCDNASEKKLKCEKLELTQEIGLPPNFGSGDLRDSHDVQENGMTQLIPYVSPTKTSVEDDKKDMEIVGWSEQGGLKSCQVLLPDNGSADVLPLIHPTTEENSFAKENSNLKLLLEKKDKEFEDLKSRLLSITENDTKPSTSLKESSPQNVKEDMDWKEQGGHKTCQCQVNLSDSGPVEVKPLINPTSASEDDHLAKENFILTLLLEESNKELEDLKSRFVFIQEREKSFQQSLSKISQTLLDAEQTLLKEQNTSKRHMEAFNKKCEDFDQLRERWLEECNKLKMLEMSFEEKSNAYIQLEGKLQKKFADCALLEASLTKATKKNLDLNAKHESDLENWKEKLDPAFVTKQQKDFDDKEGTIMGEKIRLLEWDKEELKLKLDRLKAANVLISRKSKQMEVSLSSMEKLQKERDQLKEMCKDMMNKHQQVPSQSQRCYSAGSRGNNFSERE